MISEVVISHGFVVTAKTTSAINALIKCEPEYLAKMRRALVPVNTNYSTR